MTIPWRFIVAGVLVWFAWRGGVMEFDWPDDVPANVEVDVAKPSDEVVAWVKGVDPDRILPEDRAYLSSFYSSMAFVLRRDAELNEPVITTTAKFAELQAGSLGFAIDAGDVGQYPGLGQSLDRAFFAAAGDEDTSMTPALRERIAAVCDGLAWRFWINGEE
jgi:hypothetical protein